MGHFPDDKLSELQDDYAAMVREMRSEAQRAATERGLAIKRDPDDVYPN
jgi:hypothetical protein